MMKEGDVILTPVPQADGTIKTRPAVILREMPLYKDFLVCGLSTQLHQRVTDFDEVISPSNVKRLKSESLVRLGFLALLPSSRIAGSIGSIAAVRHKKLLKTLSDYLVR